MRASLRRWAVGLAAMATAGAVYQTGCMAFSGDQVLRSVDFCFIFDCQNGLFGGVIDPCNNNVFLDGRSSTGNANTFVDCPTDDGN